MSSANTNTNNSTNSASSKKVVVKKKWTKKVVKPSPPPLSAEEVSTSDEEIDEADEIDAIADEASEASNSGNESEASIASEASEASSAESVADNDTLITSEDKNNALVGVKATEGEVADITTLLGEFTTEGWTKTLTEGCLLYRQSIIARAMEVEYFKTAPPKGKSKTKPRAERRLKYGEMELSKTGASAMRSHFLQDDESAYHNDAFKDTIAEYTYKTFGVASATDYGASPSDEFWNKQFLGGYLASEEGKARLTHYQEIAEGFEGGKKKRVKKIKEADKAQITSQLTEDELRALLAKFSSK